ncbi:hypothetical protein D9613_000070 [Agrocybe pediades]|uniref:Uncharacterized protein n=1 Tax=Agrocybe pediades TaxID=84607 RepID=A0A8H4R0Z1_9AGAR|nr:hypothetical protein D9613_000070 [Agrocybe pediades]
MARPIWVNLFYKCEHLSSGTLKLEKPLELYSSEELERVVLVWESTQVGWRTHDGIPSRRCTIKVEDVRHTRSACWSEYYRHVYLIPSGRWLLVFQTEGEISYYDLESPHYKKKEVMVHDYIRPANCNIVFFAVDISGSLPGESFRLAQYVREDPDAAEGIIYRAIKIWDIAPVLEGKVVISLHAVCLKTIPVDLEVFDGKLSMSLSDGHLAFGVSPDELVQYICVVEWSLVVDGSLDYPRRILYTSVDAVHF